VNARPNAKAVIVVGRDEFGFPASRNPVDEASSILLRLSFAPIEDVPVQRDLLEPDRIGDDEIGGYGRPPKTIRARGHRSSPVLAIGLYCTTPSTAASRSVASPA
jgi:hypothetical protein